MMIRVSGEHGSTDFVSDTEIQTPMHWLIFNQARAFMEVADEARAKYLCEVAHKGHGWTYGLLLEGGHD